MEISIYRNRKEQLEKKEWQSLQEHLLEFMKNTDDNTTRTAHTLIVLILHCCEVGVGLMSRTETSSWDRIHT